MLAKLKTFRDAKYLKWLRNQPCVVCQNPDTEAHHTTTGGMGIKGADDRAIPLCHYHHHDLHKTSGKAGTWPTEQLENIIQKLRTKYQKEMGK